MATAVFVHDGKSIDYTPGSAVTGGDVVVVGEMIGIAKLDIAANALGALSVTGVFLMPKPAGVLAIGTAVYWDVADGQVNTDPANPFFGFVVKAAANDDTTVRVLLVPKLAIANGAVVEAKLADDAVTAAKVKDGEALPAGLAVPDTKGITFGTATLVRAGNNIIATLPTSDPGVAGALWKDTATVKVSAGT